MRKILSVIVCFVCFIISFAYNKPISNPKDNHITDLLHEVLPDSLYIMLRNRPIMLYTHGHYGYSWSVVTFIDSKIHAFSGRVSYSGDRHPTEQTKFILFDSAALFSANASVLSWGFDTLPVAGLKMTPIISKSHISIYETLNVINSIGNVDFDSNYIEVFSGPDSANFNNKFHKLCLIMRWLAEPNIREYIPESLIL